jgi:hypothetical protein
MLQESFAFTLFYHRLGTRVFCHIQTQMPFLPIRHIPNYLRQAWPLTLYWPVHNLLRIASLSLVLCLAVSTFRAFQRNSAFCIVFVGNQTRL